MSVTDNVLVVTLPEPTFTGNANIFEPDGVTLSDHLRWINSSNSSSACDGSTGLPAWANRMVFYSLDDLGGQMPTFPNTMESTTENPDGSLLWVVPGQQQTPPPSESPATHQVILERDQRGEFNSVRAAAQTVSLQPPAPCRGHERPARRLPPE